MSARAALAIVLLLSSVRPAAAADAYGAALTRAIAAKERALDVNEPPRWEEALRLFQEAAALRPTRECAYEIGYAAERLKREDLAVESYEAALDLGLIGPPRGRAQGYVTAHAAALARLKVRGPAGTALGVAGLDRGRLPLARPLALYAGDVRLEVVDPAGRATTVSVHLQAGQLEVLDLGPAPPRETPLPPPPAPSPPTPSPPEPSVTVVPPAPAPPAPVTPPAPAAVPAPAPPAPERTELAATQGSPAAWPLIVSGLVVTAAAIVLVPVSNGRIDDHRAGLAAVCKEPLQGDTCPEVIYAHGDEAQAHADGIKTWKAVRLGAWIGIGAGVTAAIVGTVLKLRAPSGSTADTTPALVLEGIDGRRLIGFGWSARF